MPLMFLGNLCPGAGELFRGAGHPLLTCRKEQKISFSFEAANREYFVVSPPEARASHGPCCGQRALKTMLGLGDCDGAVARRSQVLSAGMNTGRFCLRSTRTWSRLRGPPLLLAWDGYQFAFPSVVQRPRWAAYTNNLRVTPEIGR